MKIASKYLAELEVHEDKIIDFPNGIPGFSNENKFVILDLPDNPAFHILQSVQTMNTAFIVTNPYLVYQDYSFELDQNTLEILDIQSEEDVMVLSIVTLNNPFKTSTLNLKAPIIVNPNCMRGKQFILNFEDYPSKAPVVPVTIEKGVR